MSFIVHSSKRALDLGREFSKGIGFWILNIRKLFFQLFRPKIIKFHQLNHLFQ